MNTLIKLEITRTLRNKKFMFFSVAYPAILYVVIAGGASKAEIVKGTHLTLPLLMMVSMASFGAITAVLVGNSERIAKEREKGWVRQLRLTALPGRGYVAAKIASAAVVSLPSILVVFIVAAAAKGVRFDGVWQWFALTGVIWAGSIVFAALGVAIGYLVTGDAVRPVTFIVYFGLSILGGLWMPTAVFPDWVQSIAKWVPTHAYAALGQAIEQGNAPHFKDVALMVAYGVLFAGAAAWLYRKDTHKS
ncbi:MULTISPECIES: ABC transporter permease [Streptomyces]|uniref:ABC transporter permease n=1 Tax=Streptomyces morookaense TaxID=1970 RepID=A0A7Y7BAR4_STRMO|nr:MULTISPECIES: ABC transporter permease [Streptomyces]MCC2278974.1 ABC transporter permease [Streptomyces sp. ET3-23]NVK82060.1 ABC transporter permease [Streptomyces morookaense]GHF15241.1 ABC transporter [Streptomyces morookaense]